MATSIHVVDYICEQLQGLGNVHYRKMFGEYMVYLNNKPVIIVCDNTAFVKKLDSIAEMMKRANVGVPYPGAKEHYILDIDDAELCRKIVIRLEENISCIKEKKSKC